MKIDMIFKRLCLLHQRFIALEIRNGKNTRKCVNEKFRRLESRRNRLRSNNSDKTTDRIINVFTYTE